VNIPNDKGDPVWVDATVIGARREADIAVLRLSPAFPAASLPPLRAMPVGTSADLRVGQSCYAVGAGATAEEGVSRQRLTMSAGVVSGLKRSIPSKNGTTLRNAIQTDAKIPEKASGGALVDSGGRLIGLNVTTYGAVNGGTSFAIPIDDLMTVVPSLITLQQIS